MKKRNAKRGYLGKGKIKKKYYKKYTIVETASGEKFILERMEQKEREKLEKYIKAYPKKEDLERAKESSKKLFKMYQEYLDEIDKLF